MVDINDSNNGEPAKIFIIQVAALSCTATQVPKITAAIQSFLNAGFRSAAQVSSFTLKNSLIRSRASVAPSISPAGIIVVSS